MTYRRITQNTRTLSDRLFIIVIWHLLMLICVTISVVRLLQLIRKRKQHKNVLNHKLII